MPAGGKLEGGQREIVGLLRIGRLEHRHAGRHGVAAIVLLVLTGSHARIVGRDDHQRAGHAAIGGRKEGVGRDVQAHVLHRHQRGRPAKGRTQADFQGHFFVRRPLGPTAQGVKLFEDFGRGRAGISGGQRNAQRRGLPKPRLRYR